MATLGEGQRTLTRECLETALNASSRSFGDIIQVTALSFLLRNKSTQSACNFSIFIGPLKCG